MEIIHFAPSDPGQGLGRKYKGDDGYIYRPAFVFETGKFPDKGFELDHAEADEAIRSFSPAPINVEHRPSVFDGRLGEIVEPYRNGDRLFAKLRVPEWVDKALGEEPIKLSAEWSKDPKRLVGMALVLNPRIKGAAAFAVAFSEDPDFAAVDEETRAAVLALAPEPKTPAPAPARTEGSNTSMNFAEKSKAGLSLLTPEQRASVGLTDSDISNPANFSAPEPKKDEPAVLFAARTAGKAEASRLLHQGFAFNQDEFLALYVDAVKADGGGSVTFSDDGDLTTGGKVKSLVSLIENTKRVQLNTQSIPGVPPTFSDDTKTVSDEERFKATLEGRAPQEGK